MVTTVTNNSPQAINTSLFSLQKEIDDLRRQINQINSKNTAAESELAKGLVSDDTPDMSVDEIKKLIPDTATPENQLADKDFVNSSIPTKTSQLTNDSGFITSSGSITGNAETATKAETAEYANAPTGFRQVSSQGWGNQDGEFITDWGTVQGSSGQGDISFRYNHGQLNIIIDGVFYQDEGRFRLVDENSIKDIMKPNYTTGRLPAGIYKGGQTVSVSATITTTRGNPVFISYAGDFNSVGSGDTVPWVWFKLYVDDQLVQTTSVYNSVALTSDNTAFAGNALAVLSAGSHTIRLDAVLYKGTSGQVQFQEQENIVNLVAFEL